MIRRIVRIALGVFAFLLYAWFAAVRNLPLVKRRKAARTRR
ncbi:MAG TPA: hypothetical protein VII51_08265 [Gaiellaceae bacterium]